MTCLGLSAGSFAIYFIYINYKTYKTSSNSRACEEVENPAKLSPLNGFRPEF